MQYLSELYPGKFKYTGNGSFVVGRRSADAYSKESAEQNPGRSRWHAKKAVRVTNYEKLLELLSQMSATIENMKNDDAAQCQGRGNGRVERDKKEDEYLMVKLGDQETFTKAEVLDIIMGTRTARRAN